ncbi:unnamed protein product [Rotaria sp. Silwood2]|nr:unnamed protein product [Rotaria sp. Silwood2]CAF4320541.1 unnamed protein product [Rotaria sp. Silwood2]
MPLVSLEKALEPISHFFNGILENAWVAKENCQQSLEGLTQDESASIHLYTMQFDGGPSLFYVLNRTLRAENRQDLQPWFSFLKLFLTALHKLPSHAQTVWRGVRDVDLSSKYPKGKKVAWWGVSSCTTNVEVLKNEQFLGNTGIRTIFSIECQNGKAISRHSYFSDTEDEVILMPGSYFEVIGQLNPAAGLYVIQLREINPPFPLVKPPFDKPAASIPTEKVAPLKTANPSAAISISPSPVQKSSTQGSSPRISSATIAKPLAPNSYVPKVETQAVSQATSDSSATKKLDVPYTSPNGKFKVAACDMSLYLQERIISIIIPAIEQGGKETSMAQRIKTSLDTEHKPTWHCIVGENFGSRITPYKGYFLYVAYDKYHVLVWKSG